MAALEPTQRETIMKSRKPCLSDNSLDDIFNLLNSQLNMILGHGQSFGVYAVIGAMHPYIGQCMQTRTSGHNSHLPGMTVRFFEHILSINRVSGSRKSSNPGAAKKIPCKERYNLLMKGGDGCINLFAMTTRPDRQSNVDAEAARIQLSQPQPNFVKPPQAVFAPTGHLVTEKSTRKRCGDPKSRRIHVSKHYRLRSYLQRVRSDEPPPDFTLWTLVAKRLEANHGAKRRHVEDAARRLTFCSAPIGDVARRLSFSSTP